jgi:hypothetical protein
MKVLQQCLSGLYRPSMPAIRRNFYTVSLPNLDRMPEWSLVSFKTWKLRERQRGKGEREGKNRRRREMGTCLSSPYTWMGEIANSDRRKRCHIVFLEGALI